MTCFTCWRQYFMKSINLFFFWLLGSNAYYYASTLQDHQREYTCTMTFPAGVEHSSVNNSCTQSYGVLGSFSGSALVASLLDWRQHVMELCCEFTLEIHSSMGC